MYMKKLFLILAMLLPMFAFAQKYKYEEVVKADSLTKNEIYDNAMKWIASHFGDFDKVVEHNDKEAGIITFVTKQNMGNCAATKYGWLTPIVTCKFTVEMKDGRYRITIPSNSVSMSSHDGNMDFGTDGERKETMKALEMVAEIAKNQYNYSFEWPLDEKYDSIVQFYKRQIPDKEKLNRKERIFRDCVNMLQEITDGNKSLINAIVSDMKDEIGYKDEW